MAAFWVAAFSLESLQNSLRRNWMLKQPLFLLTGCLSIHFFDSPPIFLTQLVRPPLLLTGCHATPHQQSLALSTHPLLLVLRIWEGVFYSHTFSTFYSFLLLSRLPWGWQFNLKGSRALCWSLKHSHGPIIGWITTIHERAILVGSIYEPKASFEVRVPQPWNLPLTGFEPAFIKVPCLDSRLSWQLGYKV